MDCPQPEGGKMMTDHEESSNHGTWQVTDRRLGHPLCHVHPICAEVNEVRLVENVWKTVG